MNDNIENNSDFVFPEFSLEDITSDKPKDNNLFVYLTEFNNSFINNDDVTSLEFITELYDVIHDKEFNTLLHDKTQIDSLVNENQIIDNNLTHPLKSFIDEFIGQDKPIESMEVVKTRLPRATSNKTTKNKLFF